MIRKKKDKPLPLVPFGISKILIVEGGYYGGKSTRLLDSIRCFSSTGVFERTIKNRKF